MYRIFQPEGQTQIVRREGAADFRARLLVFREGKQLAAAVKTTFPPSGETPELKPALWAPNLTDP